MKPFESFMADKLNQYLMYRHNVGYANNGATSALLAFDQYLKKQDADWQSLQPMFFLELREKINKKPRSVNTILSVLRTFFQYLVRQGIYTENPLEDVPPLAQTYFVPFVFSPQQIELLLSAACNRIRKAQKHFLKDLAIYLAIVLLARCGMRIKEPLRALLTHYRQDDGTIYIERTKFRKDRLIPVPKAALIEIENYLAVRKAFCANDQNPYLLAGRNQNGLRDYQVRFAFHQAVKDIGLDRPKRVLANMTFGSPTPHSLRHSFAINTLKRIRDQGKSPQHALPVLAIYMGHRKYQYTAAYLKVRDAKHLAGLIDFAKSQINII
jgi:site-specific recombinase XerD